jgi:hypothetical protein
MITQIGNLIFERKKVPRFKRVHYLEIQTAAVIFQVHCEPTVKSALRPVMLLD